MDKLISQQAAIDAVEFGITYAKAINKETGEVIELFKQSNEELRKAVERIKGLPSAQPERKTGRWILDRSGAYCCNRCMEPCASYAMGKPRDRFCKMCGSRNEVSRNKSRRRENISGKQKSERCIAL